MSSNSNKLLPILLGVIILLLGLNAYFIANKVKDGKVIEKQKTELSEAEKMQEELQMKFDDAIEQLDVAAAENEDLKTQIEEQKRTLERQLRKAKARISELASKENASITELAEARRMVDDFVLQRDGFLNQINNLKSQNQTLTSQNVTLSEEKTVLSAAKVTLETKVEEQTKITEELVEDKKELEDTKEKLQKKVALGSILAANSVKATGVKEKKKSDVNTDVAKRADRLMVCFELAENRIAKAGKETIFLRLINPRGETMAIESKGSGYFDDPVSGQAVRFTTSQELDYDNSAQDVCINWKQDASFDKGKYVAELYNKNHMIGTKEFTLR